MEAVSMAFPGLEEEKWAHLIVVEEPRDSSHGDFSCPAPMKLAGVLGKGPQVIGEAMIAAFPKDSRVESVSFAAPGFLNVRLAQSFLEEELKSLEQGFSLEALPDKDRPIIVEYPSTNAAKHMGVHHIITTVLGDSLANLFQFFGYEVLRINHFGDWGTHFGKLIYAIEHWGDKEAIHRDPTEELTKLYVRFNQEAEKDPALEDRARAIFKALEEGDPLRKALWDWIIEESLQELNAILRRMNVSVDMHLGESFYLEKARAVLMDGKEKGLFLEGEQGALIFDMGEGQTPALIQKSDGTTLYLTRDVATIRYRVETWHPESILYVVDHAQSLHFKQDFAISRALAYAEDTQLEHVSFGRMNFADGAMSTRKGNVIRLKDLLDEAAKKAGELAAERGTEVPREELLAMRELVGTASVKYAVLSQDRNKDIIFDWDKIITLEGNSAPYLLYSYARGSSIAKKLEETPLSGLPRFTEEAELDLMRKLVKAPEALQKALLERKPHVIATHLFELCQEFNRFYGKVQVAGAESDLAKRTRLGLVHAFLHQVKALLGILGIPVLERM